MLSVSFDYSDLEPLKLHEEEPQLCRILYDERYKKIMGLLLALLQKQEYSERALYLTEEALELIASHYSIWCYRFNIVKNIDRDLNEELDWGEQIALENEKNYQIWNYRQLLVNEILKNGKDFDPHREFPLMEAMFEEDPKNHHVWSYRKWLVERFGLHSDPRENAFVEKCLKEDVRNNSAWTHRFYLKFGLGDITEEKVQEEIEYGSDMIEVSPQNEAAWNYLRAVLKCANLNLQTIEPLCLRYLDSPDKIDSTTTPKISSVHALEFMARIHAERGETERARALFEALAFGYDPIRMNYWTYEADRLQSI